MTATLTNLIRSWITRNIVAVDPNPTPSRLDLLDRT